MRRLSSSPYSCGSLRHSARCGTSLPLGTSSRSRIDVVAEAIAEGRIVCRAPGFKDAPNTSAKFVCVCWSHPDRRNRAMSVMLGWSNAEIVVVPWITGSPPAPTWFYTRGRDSVRIEVRDHGTTFELFVSGPGARKRFVECADHWAVIESQ